LVLVTFTTGDETRRAALSAAAELRVAGIRVELGEGKLKKVFEVANKLNARLTIICGENELAAGTLSMKDMQTFQQADFPREQLLERVKACLS
jgi:histidyl-tRNA synthetase